MLLCHHFGPGQGLFDHSRDHFCDNQRVIHSETAMQKVHRVLLDSAGHRTPDLILVISFSLMIILRFLFFFLSYCIHPFIFFSSLLFEPLHVMLPLFLIRGWLDSARITASWLIALVLLTLFYESGAGYRSKRPNWRIRISKFLQLDEPRPTAPESTGLDCHVTIHIV